MQKFRKGINEADDACDEGSHVLDGGNETEMRQCADDRFPGSQLSNVLIGVSPPFSWD